MTNKNIIVTIILVVVVAIGGFYGGTIYEKNSLSKQNLLRNGNSQLGNGGQRGPGGGRFGQGQGGNNGAGDFAAGQVISKDDKSITIKTRNGGSQIVFFSDSTIVGKTVEGSAADLANGQQVMANGKNNADGSLAAQNIQIRPADQQPPGPPGQ